MADVLCAKVCSGCRQELPVERFHRNAARPDGYVTYCKDCWRRRYGRSGGRVRTADGKTCPTCSKFRTWAEFHRAPTNDGYQTNCIECRREIRRQYEARNADVMKLRLAERALRAPAAVGQKTCRKCGAMKPLLSFYAHRGTKDFRANYCMECQKEASRQWRIQNAERVRLHNQRPPEIRRVSNRRSQLKIYGLTEECYLELLAQQNGLCAICAQPERIIDPRTGEPRRLAVDHCHTSGQVRGLLCARCNRLLGLASDDVTTLCNAIAYLGGSWQRT